MRSRAISPVVGTVLLVGLTVVLAATVGAMVVVTDTEPSPSTVRVSASADATTGTLSLTHEGGDSLDPDALDLEVRIDGTALDHQPPIPFFAATGFLSGPTGPFNEATTDVWTAGETGTIRLASTNAPRLAAGDRVEFTLREDGDVVATIETTAQ